jgi:hypothetical protein
VFLGPLSPVLFTSANGQAEQLNSSASGGGRCCSLLPRAVSSFVVVGHEDDDSSQAHANDKIEDTLMQIAILCEGRVKIVCAQYLEH